MSPLSHGEMVQMARMHGNSCVICGEEIPEGRMVCPICEKQTSMTNHTMGDLISRQVVLKDLEEYIVKPENAISVHPDDIHNYNSGLLTAIQVVTDTPPAQSKRKKGKWLRSYTKGIPYRCSECTGQFDYEWKFCPNCGTDMRDEDDNIPMEYFENGGI